MNDSFYDTFTEYANREYSPSEKPLLFAYIFAGYVGVILNISVLFILIRNRSNVYRTANSYFKIGMLMGNLFTASITTALLPNFIAGHWIIGYAGCVSSYVLGTGGAAISLMFSNFMVIEEISTIVLRRGEWSPFYITSVILFVAFDYIVLSICLFWNPDIVSYPSLSESRIYCFLDITDTRPEMRIGGIVVLIYLISTPAIVTTASLFLWLKIKRSEIGLHSYIKRANTTSSHSSKKKLVIFRGTVVSISTILGFSVFICNYLYEWSTHIRVDLVADSIAVFLLSFHTCVLSPLWLILFNVRIRDELLELLYLKPIDEAAPK